MAKVRAIVCVDNNFGIGNNNDLLCSIPEDMTFFKVKTRYKTVVMGRKTYESLKCKPLSYRDNYVITSGKPWSYFDEKNDCLCVGISKEKFDNEIDEILFNRKNDIYIIGGESIYKQYIDICDELYITFINKTFTADTYFPNPEEHGFKQQSIIKEGISKKNNIDYKITKWVKNN